MNRITISIYALLLFTLSACDNNYESIFSETPDERVQAVLDEYTQVLVNAPNGWKASLYTGTGSGYFYYFAFNDEGLVNMLSDFDAETASEVMEGTWALKALQRTTLSFTTYSYIHLPAAPDGNVNNGIPGSGLLSDFEFAITEIRGDSVLMKGLQHQAELFLIRATETEQQAYLGKEIKVMIDRTADFITAFKGYRLPLPSGTEVPMAISIDRKLISFQYLDVDGQTIQRPRTSYTFTPEGIVLKDPIEVNGYVIRSLSWNDETGSYSVALDETVVTLAGTDEPFIFSPSVPLHELLGEQSVNVLIPPGIDEHPIPGQSDQFLEAYNYAATQMLQGPYRLTLQDMKFIFVPNTDRMLLVLDVTQPVSGGGAAQFSAQYTYSYQVREGGILKFKLEGMEQNASILYADLSGILMHFDNDTFQSEYIGGDFDLIAGFFSQEEPGYYFSGYLAE